MFALILIIICVVGIGIIALNEVDKKFGWMYKKFDSLDAWHLKFASQNPKTIGIEPEKIKELFSIPLIEKSFDASKVDLLDKKPSEIQEILKSSKGWFENEGMAKMPKGEQKNFLIFALAAQKIMSVQITYLPTGDLYFVESDGKSKAINGHVYKKLHRKSLIYKYDHPFSMPNIEFIIQRRYLNDTLVLTGYLQNDKDETYILFDFPMLLDNSKEKASKFSMELEEIFDYLGKDKIGEGSNLGIHQFRSKGMLISEFITVP